MWQINGMLTRYSMTGAALALMTTSGVAIAADANQNATPAKPVMKLVRPQTASIEPTVRQEQPSFSQPILSLDPDPPRFVDTTVDPHTADLAGAVASAAPAPAPVHLGPDGARFVPLIRQTDNATDPNNRGNFIDRHEFGIELKSNF
jgi:hypothetical protein